MQDGQAISPSERIAARQALPSLQQQLHEELVAEGVDVQAAAGVEDDGDVQEGEVAETGYVDEQGELRRPWCPQTRILEHREMVSSSGHWAIADKAAGRLGTVWEAAAVSSVYAGKVCTSSSHCCTAVLDGFSEVATTPHHHAMPLPLLCLQEKANQEAAAAKAADKEDPLSAAPTQQRHEVWVTEAGTLSCRDLVQCSRAWSSTL